jgi:hypothetical protein
VHGRWLGPPPFAASASFVSSSGLS